MRAGLITAEQAARHPRRNVISRALGAEIEVEPDLREIEIDDWTSFVLCSDGVTRHVTDEEIARLMKNGGRPQEVCERLKQLCYQGGAEDNLTAIVVDFGSRSYSGEEATKPRVPAQAAQARAGAGEIGETPRQAKKIEVNLSQPEIRAEPPNPDRSEAKRPKESKFRAFKRPQRETAPEGKMSKFMKMSLLFMTLIIGVVIGALLYGYTPVKGYVDRTMSYIAPHGRAQRERDPEISAAFALHLEGRSDEARSRINTALAANPSNAEALYYLGRIDLDQKKYDESVNRLKEAAKLDPKLPDVWAHLAAAYLGLGQARNAMDALQRISGQPSSAPGAGPQASPKPAG